MQKTAATILCVDDEENQLVLRKLMLEQGGYRVLTANSASKAIELFRSEAVDLVLADYYMPGMNGLSLARELRQIKRVPIVVLSAFVELPGETIGSADVWITKGTSPEELIAKLAELLSKGNGIQHRAADAAS
ncbi:MAG: response regulator [Candidatus Korobacteraceae bacterium]|jgi:CheY-like chemotaxis protein